MKQTLFVITLLAFFIISPSVHAHPGRTDGSGGHTCRTNCASWGLATGEYHSHGGGSTGGSTEATYVAPVQEVAEPVRQIIVIPTNSPGPIFIPTKIPTKIPTRVPSKVPTKLPAQPSKITLSPTGIPTLPPSPANASVIIEKSIQTEQSRTTLQTPGFFDWFFSLFK
jgi:hypothetical protein